VKKYHKFPHSCSVRNCRRKVGLSEKSDKCYKHRLRAWKEKHPHAYAWGKLKRRARARGIKFTLTIQDYKDLMAGLDLTKLVSHTSLSISVDRVENSLGYYRWNVQRMTLKENSRKQYVPYWSNGMRHHHTPEEIRHLDVEYRDRCENLADEIGRTYEKGSVKFWEVFRRKKVAMFESLTV